MTTLDFADSLVENTFSSGNYFSYSQIAQYGLCFSKESQNYPFILKGGLSDEFELEYIENAHQLRGRLLNTKRIKEVMNSAKIPLYFNVKGHYLIGKGFLSTHDQNGNHNLLFLACVDGMKNITCMEQVRLFVSKSVYEEAYKPMHAVIKDLVGAHPGDVIMCNKITDYVGEKLIFPTRSSLSELNKYKQAVVRTCLMQDFIGNPANEPLPVDTNRGPVTIMPDGSVSIDPGDPVNISSVAERLRIFRPAYDPDLVTAIPMDMARGVEETPAAVTRGLVENPHDEQDSILPF